MSEEERPEVVRLAKVMRYHPDLRGKEGEWVEGWDAATRAVRAALAGHESTDPSRRCPECAWVFGNHDPDCRLSPVRGHESTEPPRPEPLDGLVELAQAVVAAEAKRPGPIDGVTVAVGRMAMLLEAFEGTVAEPQREDPQPQYPDTFDDLAGDPTSPPR